MPVKNLIQDQYLHKLPYCIFVVDYGTKLTTFARFEEISKLPSTVKTSILAEIGPLIDDAEYIDKSSTLVTILRFRDVRNYSIVFMWFSFSCMWIF